jgi:hypothetical protein
MKIFDFIWYRLILNIPDIPRKIKWLFQKLTKGYNQLEIWSLYSHIAKYIYPRLKAFKNSKRMGIPAEFGDDTDKGFKEGQKEWEAVIDKILFAFEYILYDEENLSKKEKQEFEKKYGDIHEKKEEYLSELYFLDPPGDNDEETLHLMLKGEEVKDYIARGYTITDKWSFYYNMELDLHFKEKCAEGLTLFGIHFQNLWD